MALVLGAKKTPLRFDTTIQFQGVRGASGPLKYVRDAIGYITNGLEARTQNGWLKR